MSLNVESRLNDLQWNDLKRLAKENGIKVAGTREVLTNEILTILHDEPAVLGDHGVNKAGFESPKLTAPKKAKSTLKKSTRKKTPAKEKEIEIDFPVEDEGPIEQYHEDNSENVPPISLFPSPQIHERKSRTPMIRSPEENVARPRTPAKSKTPKKTAASVTRSARKAKPITEDVATPVVEPINNECEPVHVAKSVVQAQESKPQIEISPASHNEENGFFTSKNANRLAVAAAFVAVASSIFTGPAIASTPSAFHESISLSGPNPMYLTQGDVYEEFGVSFTPELTKTMVSEGRATPTVGYEYSQAGIAFSDYLVDVGSFDVEYSVTAPWLDDIKLTRQVVINDVNECSYDGDISAFKHTCSASEVCTNTVGSYTCQ